MSDLNQCQFIGRLGKDPEIRRTADGKAIASFSIACGWKSKDKEGTDWIPVTAFGKLAEIVEKYISKGSQIFIQGQFKTDKYTDKNGVDKYSTKIYAESIQMLGGNVESKPEAKEPPAITNIDDDIPF
jgi:single-strand DNA-binding protein